MVKAKQTSEERLHILHKLVLDSNSFFGSKELEKLAEKAGYRSIQAKDAVKMLLEENLIQTDKVAGSSVFWELRSQAYAQQDAELQSLRLAIRARNEQDVERLAQVDALQQRLQKLQEEAHSFSFCDPERLRQLTEETAYAYAAAERWTDNISIIRQFTRSRLGVPENRIDELLDL
ncbi:meiotic nuclear division protein 1 homolog [Cyclospora cayetanensis]|uniref:Meiotic nuclear division protein 1 homolog n=1 Tax=Cyclospora cayetanensis TaxID=88456 RepID=A0A6P6RTW9_9EIME|nr:meiotic nuclear division protein 1 homolog [Cyclospora cayetanensis]